jgi:hypothetical protein
LKELRRRHNASSGARIFPPLRKVSLPTEKKFSPNWKKYFSQWKKEDGEVPN